MPNSNENKSPITPKEKSSFSVHTYALIDNIVNEEWSHWSKGLTMVIKKNGITIILEENEIKQLVKSLPRTSGGSY